MNVRALNDGFTGLNSVAAMSQSGRIRPVARRTMYRPALTDQEAIFFIISLISAVNPRPLGMT